MATPPPDRLYVLEIPLPGLSLLLPSAAVAEVIQAVPLTGVRARAPWALGVIAWRSFAVPVVSIEVLLGGVPAAVTPASKLVVLYPLPGRRPDEFIAVTAIAEPRPLLLDGAPTAPTRRGLPDSPYLAAGLEVDGRVMAIPDLEALGRLFDAPSPA